jgi:hypothetical protein
LGLVCFCSCCVAVGFVAIVKLNAAIDHVVCEGVVTLTCDGYIGVDVDAANLVAKVQDRYACPKTAVAYMLVCLVKSTIHTDAWHGLQLG